jgi:spermidine/putrescine transport system permease protein
LAFTLSLDDFIITFFTAGPGSSTLPLLVYGMVKTHITPEINALSTVWLLTVFVLLLLSQLLQRRTAESPMPRAA